MRADDADKLTLEELVAVEEDVIGEPSTSGGQNTEAKVLEGQSERLDIVTGDGRLLFGSSELLAGRPHVVGTVVDEPKGANSGNGERDPVSPLGGNGRVGRVATSVVETEQQDNEEDLVEELAPTLHQEGTGDLAATVKAILLGGNLAGADSALHTGGSSHGVFTTNTDAVEEQGPGVANDPTVLGDTPSGREHNKTGGHDCGILNKTPPTTNPGDRLDLEIGVGGRVHNGTYQSPRTPTRI